MKKKPTALLLPALCLCLCLFLLAGCSVVDFFSAEGLLRAPRLTGQNAALQQAFEKAVGSDAVLVSPLTGEYRSAFIMEDCNGDGTEEAVVFYVNRGAENTVRMSLMASIEGQWRSVADIGGNGSEVYQVEFCNIDREKNREIAVTWTVSDSKRDKTLSLYKIDLPGVESGDAFNPLASVQIFDYYVMDIDRDGQNELFYVYFDSTEEKSGVYARLLKYSETDTVLYPVSEVRLDPRISNLLAIGYDFFNGRYEFFVDCAAGENIYYTEIVQYEPEQYSLVAPLKMPENDPVALTRRSSQILSGDVNGDGPIEIPTEKNLEDSFIVNTPDGENLPLRYVCWQRYEDGVFSPMVNYYESDAGQYRIRLDPFLGDLCMIDNYETGETEFRVRGVSASVATPAEAAPIKDADLLFRITVLSSGEGRLSSCANGLRISVGAMGRERNLTKKYIESLIEGNG